MARNRKFEGISDLEREFELDMESDSRTRRPSRPNSTRSLRQSWTKSTARRKARRRSSTGSSSSNRTKTRGRWSSPAILRARAAPVRIRIRGRPRAVRGAGRDGARVISRRPGQKIQEKQARARAGKQGSAFCPTALSRSEGGTQLARGDLKGALLPLAKTALGTVVPGGPAALGVLQGLGFETAEDAGQNQFGWQNYTRMARRHTSISPTT